MTAQAAPFSLPTLALERIPPPVSRSNSNGPPFISENKLIRNAAVWGELHSPAETAGTLCSLSVSGTPSVTEKRSLPCFVNHLPSELLLEIFRSYFFDTRQPPIFLVQICRQWRETALSTSQLWTIVPTVNLDSPARNGKVQSLQSYLRWSGDAPLSITLVNVMSTPIPQPMMFDMFDAIVAHSHRWCNAVIEIDFQHIRKLFETYIGLCRLCRFRRCVG